MSEPIRIGRYVVGRELAAGGMASVFLGRMSGPAGFGKTVAVKRMHPQFAKDAEFISMFLDEARVTSGLMHPNIVMTLDVLEQPGELLLIMEYVHGGSLASILRACTTQAKPTPAAVAAAIVVGALNGLHAAHEARADDGEPLHLVHRDVSPQNILVSADGLAKIADFGIAKAVGQVHSTSEGVTKGKQAYMAPEQAIGETVTARADVFAMGIVLWEALVGKRLISGASGPERLNALLRLNAPPPTSLVPTLPPAIDEVLRRALARDPNERYATASEMAVALEQALPPATQRDVSAWVRDAIAKDLTSRDEKLADLHRWCRTMAPEMATSVRDLAAPIATAPLPPLNMNVRGGTELLTPTGEVLKSDTAIATERDVVASHDPSAQHRTRKVMLLVGAAVLAAFGLIGIALIAIVVMRPVAPSSPVVAASSTSIPAPAAPPPQPSPDPEPEPVATAAEVVDASVAKPAAPAPAPAPPPAAPAPAAPAPPTVVAIKPKPATSAKPVCKIIPQKDAAGRTVFKEVCP